MNHITLPIDIESLEIVSQSLDAQGNIVIEVKSKKNGSSAFLMGIDSKIHKV
jgi:hypothetical protein